MYKINEYLKIFLVLIYFETIKIKIPIPYQIICFIKLWLYKLLKYLALYISKKLIIIIIRKGIKKLIYYLKFSS